VTSAKRPGFAREGDGDAAPLPLAASSAMDALPPASSAPSLLSGLTIYIPESEPVAAAVVEPVPAPLSSSPNVASPPPVAARAVEAEPQAAVAVAASTVEPTPHDDLSHAVHLPENVSVAAANAMEAASLAPANGVDSDDVPAVRAGFEASAESFSRALEHVDAGIAEQVARRRDAEKRVSELERDAREWAVALDEATAREDFETAGACFHMLVLEAADAELGRAAALQESLDGARKDLEAAVEMIELARREAAALESKRDDALATEVAALDALVDRLEGASDTLSDKAASAARQAETERVRRRSLKQSWKVWRDGTGSHARARMAANATGAPCLRMRSLTAWRCRICS